MTTEVIDKIETRDKLPRSELIQKLRERDGDTCQYPGCGNTLDFSISEGPMQVTIDHYMPQWWCKEQGWTQEEIWDLSNLNLQEKRCNARKGERVPNEDGSLPERVTRTFKYRRDKRATRPELCEVCNNGHNLAFDEVCASCGCDAQRFPRWAKVKASECDHELFWCWWCSITPEVRPTSIAIAMRQADSTEIGEFV